MISEQIIEDQLRESAPSFLKRKECKGLLAECNEFTDAVFGLPFAKAGYEPWVSRVTQLSGAGDKDEKNEVEVTPKPPRQVGGQQA